MAAYKLFIDYPEAEVTIPGKGPPTAGVITDDPTSSAVANDLDYGIIVVAAGVSAIVPPRLFSITFERCRSTTPGTSEFNCVVKQASDPNGRDVPADVRGAYPMTDGHGPWGIGGTARR